MVDNLFDWSRVQLYPVTFSSLLLAESDSD